MQRPLPIVSAAAVACLAGSAFAQPYNFIGTDPNGSDWFSPANWNPSGIPGQSPPGVEVVIGQGLHAYLGLNGAPPTVAAISGGGLLTINQGITVAGGATLTDVNIRGTGAAAVVCDPFTMVGSNSTWRSGRIIGRVEQGGSLLIGGTGGTSGNPALYGLLRNAASVVQSSRLYLYDGSIVENTGSWAMHSHVSDGIGENGSGGTFKNLPGGLLSHISPGTSEVSARFESDALIRIGQAGLIYIYGPQTRIGCPVELLDGGSLLINQSSLPGSTVSLGGTFTGTGDVRLENMALCSVPGGVTSALSAGSATGLKIAIAGEVQLGGSLNNDGKMHWQTGRITGPGFVRNRSGGAMTVGIGAGTSAVLATELFNDAFMYVQGSPRLDGGTIRNNAAGVIELVTGGLGLSPGASGELRNAGRLQRSAGPGGPSFMQAPMTMLDGGVLRIEDGGMYIQAGSDWSGSTSVDLGPATSARLYFDGSADHVVTGGTHTFTGAGIAEVRAGAELLIENGGQIVNEIAFGLNEFGVVGTLITEGAASFRNRGKLRITGTADCLVSSSLGFGIVNESVMTVQNGDILGPVQNQQLLEFHGTCQLGSAAGLSGYIENAATGVMTLNGSGSIESHAQLSGIQNNGMLSKLGTGQFTVFGPGTLRNDGIVWSSEGTLQFACPVSNIAGGVLADGAWITSSGARLLLPGPINSIGPGAQVHGNAATCPWLPGVSVNGGSLHFFGEHTHGGPFSNAGGGSVTIDPASDVTVPGGVTNGSEGSILDEIVEVPVISDGPESMLTTPFLHNYARLVPGGHGRAGYFNLTGDLHMRPSGRIECELGGPEPVGEHDAVVIVGSATLGGALALALIDGFVPAAGAQFTVLSASGRITGQFASLIAPASGPANVSYELVYTPTAVRVHVLSAACYANCDGSTVAPVLNVLDFNCFLNRFNSGQSYANCDGSTTAPVLNILDFNCFLNRFNTGCTAQ